MTTDIEQQFFKVFGIEATPIELYGHWLIKGTITKNEKGEKVVYPEITAEKLLELICIYNNWYEGNYKSFNIKDLKIEVLEKLIGAVSVDWIRQQVRSLFEEGE